MTGYTQKDGTDFFSAELYSPVAFLSSIRAFLTRAAVDDWEIVQIDIKNAFITSDLDEHIWVWPPEGFQPVGLDSNLVPLLKLKKSWYGEYL